MVSTIPKESLNGVSLNTDYCLLGRDAAQFGSLINISVYPEDGGTMFLQNIGNNLPDYVASYPKKL
jgi:hypothetical protein